MRRRPPSNMLGGLYEEDAYLYEEDASKQHAHLQHRPFVLRFAPYVPCHTPPRARVMRQRAASQACHTRCEQGTAAPERHLCAVSSAFML